MTVVVRTLTHFREQGGVSIFRLGGTNFGLELGGGGIGEDIHVLGGNGIPMVMVGATDAKTNS